MSEAIAHAVLFRAVQDLTQKTIADATDARALAPFRRDSILFCTQERGAWAESRNDWCTIAGVDPDAFRAKIVALLDGEHVPDVEGYAKFGNGLDDTREMWREMNAFNKAADKARHKQAEIARTRARQPAPVTRRELAKRMLRELLASGEEYTVREINFAFDGNVGESAIRKSIKDLMEDGEVTRDIAKYKATDHRTILHSNAVAA